MKKIVFSVIIMFSFLSVQLVCAQHQISVNIVGEGADDSGKSVSINSDGTYVAIGAPENDGSASNAGHVRVYREFFEAYSQRGGDIDSEAADDQSGFSVSINSDGTIVAIGAPYNDGNGADSGHVRVYEYISSTWTQVGSDIDGEAAGDQSGYSVSINADGTIVAIGALYNDGNGSSSGHVRVYQNQSGTWTQLGGDIDGEASGDLSGRSVSISDDGTIVAIGASGNDDNGSGSGHVRVYQYNSGSNTWSQLGGDINGEAASDSSGASVSINSDGTIVAIGAPFNDGTVGSNRGHVRVYEYSSTSNTWTQVGADIDGEVPDDRFGTSVGINADGKFLVVGAPYNDESTVEAGLVRTYQNVYGTWTRVGANVFGPENGDNTIDYFGTSVGINDKGTVIAAGAPQENDFGNKGYVKMILTMNRWSGSTDNDWNTIGHWSLIMIPGLNDLAYIPSGITNYPTLTFPITVNTIILESGASFISTGDNFATATMMYKRELSTTNWYLTAAPVTGLDIDDFVANADLATGTGNNIALGSYDNTVPGWTYYQDGTSNSDTFTPGVGYAVKKTKTGSLDYRGTMNYDDVSVSITRNANGFNLLGNPYPSYIAGNTGASNLLTTNTSILEETTIWLWNQATDSYDQKNLASAEFKIAPAQAFFVEAKTGGGSFSITEAMQSHNTTDTFQRMNTTSRPEIYIAVSDGSNSKSVDVYYIEGTTIDFDNGYDSSIFNGVSSDFSVYTGLINGDQNKKLGIQSLPDSGFENMVITIGLKADSGSIEFDIQAVNLPTEIDIYLEDREANTFTKIEDIPVSIALETSVNGTGRFYLHTTSESLSTDGLTTLKEIEIFSNENKRVTIKGISSKSSITMFSIIGKEIANRKLEITPNQTLSFSSVSSGVYIVQIRTEEGSIHKKIVLK